MSYVASISLEADTRTGRWSNYRVGLRRGMLPCHPFRSTMWGQGTQVTKAEYIGVFDTKRAAVREVLRIVAAVCMDDAAPVTPADRNQARDL